MTDKIELTATARRVLDQRYLIKDKDGNVTETPEDMFRRVAITVASAEQTLEDATAVADKFYTMMTNLEFLPNSPTLMNAGRELGQLSACFVLPIEDDMTSIFEAVKNTALIHKSGGGTGFSFSRLRPANDRVGSTGGVASGPVSFMRVFDTATDVVKQGGTRRGANMGILRVDHPDILAFIGCKEDKVSFTNFNISVALTMEFMEALKKEQSYNLIHPVTGAITGELNAKAVFDKIVDMAWRTGDPGIIFIDRINDFNPTPHLGKIESTNPCGEQPLLPYESCNLGSINLSKFVWGEINRDIDWDHLKEVVDLAVRFLDNVIDVNKYPIKQIEEMTKGTRKIGLGVMGFADMLIKLNIPYNSVPAIKLAEQVMDVIDIQAYESSCKLATERGAYPLIRDSDVYIRNATLTTIAPTGSLSIIAGCSSGIEPLFALSYTMRALSDTEIFTEVSPYFEVLARERGFYSWELMQKLAEGTHLADIDGVPEEIKRLFVTSHEIIPEWHIKMQAAFQKYTNNAVSKTINFPQGATRDDVDKAYRFAYEEGLKGITIYRDRSRDVQVLNTGITKDTEVVSKLKPRKRPVETKGTVTKVNTGCGALYITVAYDEQGICEVFSTLGKTGACASAQLEAMCRLISLSLRSGVAVAEIVKQLHSIRCPSPAWGEGKPILSCADAVASVLMKHVNGESLPDSVVDKNKAGQCPECSTVLVYQEGCFHCPACGYTKC